MNRTIWKEYFQFTKRDRNAVMILLIFIAAIMASPYLVTEKKSQISIDQDLQQQLNSYVAEHPVNDHYNKFISSADTTHDSIPVKLFAFDPNTLDEAGFEQLGLSQKVIHTLINYRSKGGYFKTPDDIRKVYGLAKADADRLIPYIHITSSNTKQKEDNNYEQPKTYVQNNHYKKININTATAEDWKAFPGIGDVIGNRIIKFRTSIGGFKSVDQVGKTYGLTDSVFQSIKPYLYLKDSSNNNP